MNESFNSWSKVDTLSLESTVNLVLTNGTPLNIKCDDWLLKHIGSSNQPNTVLDFGCGIGRNIFPFSDKMSNWKFFGYDNINMLNKAKEYALVKFQKNTEDFVNIEFIDKWELLRFKKFDCIYATIVFQHIREKDLNNYLQDIKQMTNRLVVSGRRFNDDVVDGKYKNTWQILENNGFYPLNDKEINYKINGDPNEHITCIYDCK